MKNIIFLLSGLLILSLFNSGCVPSKPTDDVELLPSERLINRLESNRRKIRNFEGNGTITVKSRTLDNSALFRVVVQKPDSVYLTILGPFGIELAQALVTKNDFIFYDALRNTAYRGKPDDQVLREIFKIDLAFNDLIDAFIGAVNLTDKLYRPPAKYEVDYDQYILTYIDSLTFVSTIYKVDIRQLGLKEYILKDGYGHTVLTGKYSRFELIENVAVPYRIEVQNAKENQRVTIEYKRIAANSRNVSINFRLPTDASIIEW